MAASEIQKSPLHDDQAKAGASFIEFAGWEIADHYGNPVEEHLAVRNGVGLIDLSHRGKIKAEGDDRTTFLHAMTTNDVKNMCAGDGLYATLLNAQARILADLYVYAFDQYFLIDCSALLTRKILETLDKYIVMERVTLKDRTSDFAFLALEGPHASSLMEKITGEDLSKLNRNAHATKVFWGLEVEILRCSLTGESGFAILTEAQDAQVLWNLLLTEGKAFGLRFFGRAAANSLRLEAGIPWYGVDMDEQNLLPETGLEHAVSYTKGCYIGQEVVARLQTYAQVNKKLMGIEILTDEIPERAAKLLKNGKEMGYLTSVVFSPVLRKVIGMAYLHKNATVAGNEFEIQSAGKTIQVRVVDLPFIPFRKT